MKTSTVAALGLSAALAAAVAGLTARDSTRNFAEPWPAGGRPARVTCEWVTVLEESEKAYARIQVCDSADAGSPKLPVGVVQVGDRAAGDGGTSKVEAGGFDCACSTGTNCEEFRTSKGRAGAWVAATGRKTLGPGLWRGAGCIQKACVELWRGDATSWPAACPGD